MIEFRQEIAAALELEFRKLLDKDLKAGRQRAAQALVFWLINDARKRTVPDLEQRLADLRDRIYIMADEMHLEFKEGKLVVAAVGSSQDVLQMLRRGTAWFEGTDEVENLILTGILDKAA